eukprot:gene34147-44121_t
MITKGRNTGHPARGDPPESLRHRHREGRFGQRFLHPQGERLHHRSHQKKGKGVKLSILEERMRIFDFSTPFDF